MKSEMKMPCDRDREWKVKWKWLKIESEKWNENALRLRSEISREILESLIVSAESSEFSPPCIFKCVLKLFAQNDANYIGCICLTFSIVCFKCLLKWPASEYAYSHWLHDCLISLDCVFSNVSSNCVGHGMQKNIGCNSNAVCSIDVFSKCLLWRMDYHTNCTCGLFSTVLLNVSSTCMSGKSHWMHFFDFSPLCVFKCLLKLPAWHLSLIVPPQTRILGFQIQNLRVQNQNLPGESIGFEIPVTIDIGSFFFKAGTNVAKNVLM